MSEGYLAARTERENSYLETLRALHGKLQGILEAYGQAQNLDENKHTQPVPLATGWNVQIDSVSPEDANMGYETSSDRVVYIRNPIEVYLMPREANNSGNSEDREIPYLQEDDNILFVIGTDCAVEESNDCAKLELEELIGLTADVDSFIIPWLVEHTGNASE